VGCRNVVRPADTAIRLLTLRAVGVKEGGVARAFISQDTDNSLGHDGWCFRKIVQGDLDPDIFAVSVKKHLIPIQNLRWLLRLEFPPCPELRDDAVFLPICVNAGRIS